jgi:DNA-binding CsgD family transcriptional regulator
MSEVPPLTHLDRDCNPTDDRKERQLTLVLGLVFATMTVLVVFDVAFDFQEAVSPKHQLVSVAVILIGLIGVAVTGNRLIRSLRRERILRQEVETFAARWKTREQQFESEAAALARQLEATEQEACHWKSEAGGLLAGLGGAIDAQFDRWALTPAEREVGLLLLKGLSHKEIAAVRRVGEATVRQQAQGMYRKAGLSSRNDLAAFFLEDLLLPTHDAPTAQAGIHPRPSGLA